MNKKGYTLLELLCVFLVIGILAVLALPIYFSAVERSRVSEAEVILSSVVKSQQHYKFRKGSGYTTNWKALDQAPSGVGDGTSLTEKGTYCTKVSSGAPYAAVCGNGFEIALIGNDSSNGNTSGVVATRVGNNQYGKYKIGRFYDKRNDHYPEVRCRAADLIDGIKVEVVANSQDLCIEFLNTDEYGDIDDVAHIMPSLPEEETNP